MLTETTDTTTTSYLKDILTKAGYKKLLKGNKTKGHDHFPENDVIDKLALYRSGGVFHNAKMTDILKKDILKSVLPLYRSSHDTDLQAQRVSFIISSQGMEALSSRHKCLEEGNTSPKGYADEHDPPRSPHDISEKLKRHIEGLQEACDELKASLEDRTTSHQFVGSLDESRIPGAKRTR